MLLVYVILNNLALKYYKCKKIRGPGDSRDFTYLKVYRVIFNCAHSEIPYETHKCTNGKLKYNYYCYNILTF